MWAAELWFARMAHFPIPAPATLELLKNAPVYSGEIQKELVTPTGAAIVSVLASRFSQFPAMKTVKTGYGAGSRNFKNSSLTLSADDWVKLSDDAA